MKQLAVALALTALAAVPARAQAPQRVASANLCADQLLMALADDTQIASLSPLSRDRTISYLADRAGHYPVNRASGEDLLRADADLVLVGTFDSRYTRDILDMQHIRSLVLAPWTGLDMGRQQILTLAGQLHQEDRGAALVRDIDDALARLPKLTDAHRPSFLTVHRRGFVSHGGLATEILTRIGLKNAAEDFGLGDYGFVSLEALVRRPPDFLVVDDATTDPEDMGQAFLLHPALQKLWPMEKRIVAPSSWSICGGPSTPPLIDAIGREVEKKVLSVPRP